MSSLKKSLIMLKLLLRGYSESNQKEELYLHEALRKSTSLKEFKNISMVLGKAGGLFCVPTLMAFAKDEITPQAKIAQATIDQIRERVKERDNPEMKDFFTLSFWQPRWFGTKEQLISYVACIVMLFQSDSIFEGDLFDNTGEKVLKEIEVDISPYKTFKELRICTSDWEAKQDLVGVLSEIKQDILVQSVMLDGSIKKSPEALYEENMLNMKCDYFLTRLKLKIDYSSLHYLLKAAHELNHS